MLNTWTTLSCLCTVYLQSEVILYLHVGMWAPLYIRQNKLLISKKKMFSVSCEKCIFIVMLRRHLHYHAKKAFSLSCQKGIFTVVPKRLSQRHAKKAFPISFQKVFFSIISLGQTWCIILSLVSVWNSPLCDMSVCSLLTSSSATTVSRISC